MTDTELLIRDCLSSYAGQAEQVDLVRAAKAQRGRASRVSGFTARAFSSRRSIAAVAVAAVVVVLGTVFLIGSFHTTSTTNADLRHQGASLTPARHEPAGSRAPLDSTLLQQNSVAGQAPIAAPTPAPSVASGDAGPEDFGIAAGATAQAPQPSGASGVTATRLVKTGSMSLTVDKGQVGTAITSLVRMTRSLGGYVSNSHTDDIDSSPSGEVTLRMPVNNFEQAVAGAQKIGHQTALSTSAHDVTGKYVDLHARLTALQRTRQTYLTILSRATTIGEILSVQQRVDDTQSQIERLQGELKVLRNQSADGTLTVDVSEKGAAAAITQKHHHRSGLSKAWHDSTTRFSHGVDAIVGALGPLLLALILLGIALVVIRLGMRRARRATP